MVFLTEIYWQLYFNSMYVMWSGIDHSNSGWHVINLRKKKKCEGLGDLGWGEGGHEKKAEERGCFPRTQKQTGLGSGKGRVVRLAGADCAVVYTGNEFLFIASYGGETAK